MPHRVLLVEDDLAIGEPLARSLRREGYVVDWAQTGAEALRLTEETPADLVLLDLSLPDMDGLDVCAQLRAAFPSLPIVMCTARAEEIDIIVGFESGADDYVTKPFSLAELKVRLRARLRLSVPPTVMCVGNLKVDETAHKAWFGEEDLTLTPKEFALLALLVKEAGRVVPRSRIMQEVWDEHYFGTTRTLDMHISWLRKKLHDDGECPTRIVTVRGVGFRYELQS
jgi:DNA-binding response OmpR family regulator